MVWDGSGAASAKALTRRGFSTDTSVLFWLNLKQAILAWNRTHSWIFTRSGANPSNDKELVYLSNVTYMK